MFHESTDLHRARVGTTMTVVLIALCLGWFPANELLYMVAGRTTDAHVIGYHAGRYSRYWTHRRNTWVEYTYRDTRGHEHRDWSKPGVSGYRQTAGNIRIEYHTFPWRSSRAAGVYWPGLVMFGVFAVAAAGLLAWNWYDVQQFWRRERDMAGF